MNIISIIWAIGFFFMCGYSLYINIDWAKTVSEMNNSWHELATRQNKEWADECLKLINECDRLKKELEEMKHE